jgi:hypothetical protein
MLLLTAATDQLQVLTDAAGPIHAHASWVDITPSTAAIAPGRANTIINAASAVSIAGSPVASTQRNVKTVHLFNKGSINCGVTIQAVDAGGTFALYNALLTPGSMLELTDMGGIRLGRV